MNYDIPFSFNQRHYPEATGYSTLSINRTNFNPFYQPDDSAYKTVHDPIHGYMTFSKLMWKIIDTPQFQRLRNLKQLSTISFIYPGGNHTRFEHCLGTGYLANDLVIKGFKSINRDDKFLISAVSIAGLCHDIGHGPFSHTFNSVLDALDLGIHWEHEAFSKIYLQYLIDSNNIDMDEDMFNLVNALIEGKNDKTVETTDEPWIFEIVANKTNSIDVDKFDYICRDIYHLGLKCSTVDYKRVFNDCRIIDNKICFADKNEEPLKEIFNSRFELFKKVYKHNKNLCIDTMVKDALILSNDYFHFEEAINNPELFMGLDDNIIHVIKNFSKSEDEDIRNNVKLLKAEKIIRDLYARDTYRFVGEILIPTTEYYVPDVNEFLTYNNPNDEYFLRKEDIDIIKTSIDYGNGILNPFESIHFYNPKIPDKKFKRLQQNALNFPSIFKEYYIKIICKDEKKLPRAKELFAHYHQKLLNKWNEKPKRKENNKETNDLLHQSNNSNSLLSTKRSYPFSQDINTLTPIKKNKE